MSKFAKYRAVGYPAILERSLRQTGAKSRFEGNQFQPNQPARPPELSHLVRIIAAYTIIYHVPYVGDGVHGVPKPDVGLCPQVPHGGIPWNNIDNFGQQVDDSLVILMLEMAICLLKPLLNMLDKAGVLI